MGIFSVGIPVTNERLIQKFFASIDEKESIEKCWNWKPNPSSRYGHLRIGKVKGPNFYTELAHRFSYRMHMGEEIPEGMQVCHKCDNPRCVNPFHLFIATQMDNMKDKIAKGRDSKGEKHSTATKLKALRGDKNPISKLKENDIPLILQMKRDLKTNKEIANIFNVSRTAIFNIFAGISWTHISDIEYKRERRGTI